MTWWRCLSPNVDQNNITTRILVVVSNDSTITVGRHLKGINGWSMIIITDGMQQNTRSSDHLIGFRLIIFLISKLISRDQQTDQHIMWSADVLIGGGRSCPDGISQRDECFCANNTVPPRCVIGHLSSNSFHFLLLISSSSGCFSMMFISTLSM